MVNSTLPNSNFIKSRQNAALKNNAKKNNAPKSKLSFEFSQYEESKGDKVQQQQPQPQPPPSRRQHQQHQQHQQQQQQQQQQHNQKTKFLSNQERPRRNSSYYNNNKSPSNFIQHQINKKSNVENSHHQKLFPPRPSSTNNISMESICSEGNEDYFDNDNDNDDDDDVDYSENNVNNNENLSIQYQAEKGNLINLHQELFMLKEKIRALHQDQISLHERKLTLKRETKSLVCNLTKLKNDNEKLKYGNLNKRKLLQLNSELQMKYENLQMKYNKRKLLRSDRESHLFEAKTLGQNFEYEINKITCQIELLQNEIAENNNNQNFNHYQHPPPHHQQEALDDDAASQLPSHYYTNNHKYSTGIIERDMKLRQLHNQLIEQKGNIRVIVRFLPTTQSTVKYLSDYQLQIPIGSKLNPNEFDLMQFNRIFSPNSKQSEIFEEVEPLLTSFVDGYSVCVMTYGQTGSGKTYTMQGTQSNPGIISRSLRHVLSLCSKRLLWRYQLTVSILQIYNEVMMDLLTEKLNRVTIKDSGNSVIVKDLTEHEVNCEEDIVEYIKLGRKRRNTNKTRNNPLSSRSHFIVMLHAKGSCEVQSCLSDSVLTLCDLAGFEQIYDENLNIFNESKYISKSLAVLGRVFDSLKNKDKMVPYRDSRLTHLLKPSLSGQSKFILILTASGAPGNIAATHRTLQLGQKAMNICLGQAKKNVTIDNNYN